MLLLYSYLITVNICNSNPPPSPSFSHLYTSLPFPLSLSPLSLSITPPFRHDLALQSFTDSFAILDSEHKLKLEELLLELKTIIKEIDTGKLHVYSDSLCVCVRYTVPAFTSISLQYHFTQLKLRERESTCIS